MLRIFPWAHWPLEYLLWRKVYSSPLLLLLFEFLLLLLWKSDFKQATAALTVLHSDLWYLSGSQSPTTLCPKVPQLVSEEGASSVTEG